MCISSGLSHHICSGDLSARLVPPGSDNGGCIRPPLSNGLCGFLCPSPSATSLSVLWSALLSWSILPEACVSVSFALPLFSLSFLAPLPAHAYAGEAFPSESPCFRLALPLFPSPLLSKSSPLLSSLVFSSLRFSSFLFSCFLCSACFRCFRTLPRLSTPSFV